MANYRGIFYGFNLGPAYSGTTAQTKYRIDFIQDTGDSNYEEILLAGGDPVKLIYDSSETPFDPLRTSRLSVNVVCDTYLEDILPSTPQEVRVVLYNITLSKTEWVGWLSPMVLSAGYRDEFETFELQANDCLLTLQYFPYEPLNGDDVDFVSFRDILGRIVDVGEQLDGFRWPMTKSVSGSTLYPEQLLINEKNFYYSDVDETIKLDEVLEEICKYVGMTAVQMGKHICLIDYQSLGKTNSHRMVNYLKASDYVRGSENYWGGTVELSQEYVSGPGPSITIEPIRNKIEVKDNFYKADYFIPSPFDDNLLTNRLDEDNFYYTKEIPYSTHRKPGTNNYYPYPWYPDGTRFIFGQKYSEDRIYDKKNTEKNTDDSSYRYFHRVYDHKFFDCCYNGTAGKPTNYTAQIGGTIVDHAAVKNDYVNEYGQMTIANKRDFTRYLMIRQNNTGVFPIDWNIQHGMLMPTLAVPMQTPVFKLKSGYKADVMLGSGSYLVISANALFTRYDVPYINPIWTSEGNKIKWSSSKTRIAASGCLAFNLGIGGKWWNGSSWQDSKVGFWVPLERTQDEYPFWMTDSPILNNIRWDNFINADGYKIPLDGVDTTGELQFEILLPSLQWYFDNSASYNGYCWLRDLSIKAYKQGQDADMTEEEKDYTITNIISTGSVQEMQTIELKITTANETSNPSWSDCIYSGSTKSLLQSVYEPAISTIYQTPEMNIVQKYVDQYSNLTKKITMDLPLTLNQFNRLSNVDVDSPEDKYVMLGTEISFADGKQTVELIKKN